MVLGSTSGGTMRLREDDKGLWIEVDPPETQVGRDVVEYIRRGDVTGQSFMFTIKQEEWIFAKSKEDKDLRIIKEVELYEAGPVTMAAYSDTTVGLRSSTDTAYEQARNEWEARNRPEEPITIVSPEPYLLKVRLLKARG
jgi:HK97 family phage prohead protease